MSDLGSGTPAEKGTPAVALTACKHAVTRVTVSGRLFFFFQAEDGIRDLTVTGVQTCALPISGSAGDHQRPAGAAQGPVAGIGRAAQHLSPARSGYRPHRRQPGDCQRPAGPESSTAR